MSDAPAWLNRYSEIWPVFDHERIHELVHPDARIFHAGMSKPITGAQEPEYARRAKLMMPDIAVEIRAAAFDGDVVFVEYTTRGTPASGALAGRRLSWDGIGRFRLRGDRVIDAVGRWDTLPLWAELEPSMAREGSFLQASVEGRS
jgi:SnoaL-like domain